MGAPRTMLRLSSILANLCDNADANPSADSQVASPAESTSNAPPVARRFRKKPRALSYLTIGDIVDRTSHAGFGFLLAFLALVSIPFFGLSTPFGLAITFVAIQMVIGRKRPWLPKNIRKRHISWTTLNWITTRLARWSAGLEKLIRPRFTFLVRGPFWIVCGMAVVFQGLGLAMPLPIPGSNWFFILPVLVYAIGLLEDDGLLILAAHAITVTEIVILLRTWKVVTDALQSLWS